MRSVIETEIFDKFHRPEFLNNPRYCPNESIRYYQRKEHSDFGENLQWYYHEEIKDKEIISVIYYRDSENKSQESDKLLVIRRSSEGYLKGFQLMLERILPTNVCRIYVLDIKRQPEYFEIDPRNPLTLDDVEDDVSAGFIELDDDTFRSILVKEITMDSPYLQIFI